MPKEVNAYLAGIDIPTILPNGEIDLDRLTVWRFDNTTVEEIQKEKDESQFEDKVKLFVSLHNQNLNHPC